MFETHPYSFLHWPFLDFSAFVGHINNGEHKAETYLAAAVLSDMVLNICITPPLAFNQVLNGLVSQAIGSGNPAMAGVWLQQVRGLIFLLFFDHRSISFLRLHS